MFVLLYNKFKDPTFVGMTSSFCIHAKQMLRSAFTAKLHIERSEISV